MQTDFHKEFPRGGVGKQHPFILKCFTEMIGAPGKYDSNPTSVLDYGAGKGGTAQWLESLYPKIFIEQYDPSFNTADEWREIRNRYYDFVYSVDVLEHIARPDCVNKDGAIPWINSCTRNYAFLVIDLTPAKKKLSDGRNAHINLQEPNAWLRDIEIWMRVKHWEIHEEPCKTYGVRKRLCVRAERGKKM